MLVAETSSAMPGSTAAAALGRLRFADAEEIRSFWRSVERYRAGTNLGSGLHAGMKHAIILSGWACEMCVLPDGRRQIFSIFIPGDWVEIRRQSDLSLRSFVALTRLELADPNHQAICDEAGEQDAAASISQANKAVDDRLFVHMTWLGQLNAQERVLSFLLELYERLDAVGLVRDETFRLPLSQEILADALGLSIVHLNRTVRQLRGKGVIDFKARSIKLVKRAQIEALIPHSASILNSLRRGGEPKYAEGSTRLM